MSANFAFSIEVLGTKSLCISFTSLGSIILGFLALFLFGKKAEIERKFSELSSYLVQHPAFHPNPLGSSMKTLVFCL